jgi:predicted DNA-binding protein YlxM (UPF0122 family)
MHKNVQRRAVVTVAMKPYCTHSEIGEVIQRDRTAVYHYLRHHEDNMKHWEGYAEMYYTVKPEIDDVLAEYSVKLKISEIENEITRLIQARDIVKAKLKAAEDDRKRQA